MAVDKPVSHFSFFKSYYEIMKKLTPEQRDRLLMGMLAFAFDGEWPDFSDDLSLELSFTGMEPNITNSIKNITNGGNGGRPKGKNTPKNPPSKPGLKPSDKTPLNTYKDKERDRDKESKGTNNLLPLEEEDYSSSDGAVAVKTAPPAEQKAPVCPECGKLLKFTPNPITWSCAEHGTVEPKYA